MCLVIFIFFNEFIFFFQNCSSAHKPFYQQLNKSSEKNGGLYCKNSQIYDDNADW